MGVSSKALRVIVLLAAVGWIGACSFNQPIDESGQNLGDTQASANSQGGSDRLADSNIPGSEGLAQEASTATAGAISDLQNNLPNNGMAAAQNAVSSQELVARADGGIGIQAERGSMANKYLVDLGQPDPVFDVTMISNPPRLVVDVLGKKGKGNREIALSDDSYLKSIRLGAHKDRTRIVFDLKQDVDQEALQHEVTTENGKLVVNLQGLGMQNAAIETASMQKEAAELVALAPAAAPVAEEPVQVAAQQEIPVIEPVLPTTESTDAVAEEVASQTAADMIAKNVTSSAAEPVANDSQAMVSVERIAFEKSVNDSGQITIASSEPVAYSLDKTAPSEYTLTIPSATPSDEAMMPQIAPKGSPGIRTVRTSRSGSGTVVRMFVDAGTDLRAIPNGSNILIKSSTMAVANDPTARAQLESADQPQAAAAPAPAAENKPAAVSAPNDDLARANPSGLRSADGSKNYTGRLISLDLQDTDIDNALRIIAEVSNLNIIASDDVTGKVTLRLIDVPWDQALDVILKTNGLDQVTEGNVIRIAPIDKLRQEREALREAEKAKQLLERLTVDYIRVSYARAAELKEQVEAVLTERGTVSIDERTNQLIVKDIKEGHESSRDLLKKLDLRTPQVLLETQIVESGRNILRDLGFQWNFSYTQSPQTGNATGLNFPNSVQVGGSTPAGNLVSFPAVISDEAGSAISAILDSADGSRALSARLSALEDERKVRVVSRPQVATVNNKQAEIRSVETFRVRTPSAGTAISTGAGAQASGSSNSAFEEIKVGIELRVTPQASPDYFVLLDVEAKSSTLGASAPVDNIPSTLDREATSTILVKSGQTFALGGVYRLDDTDQIQGVPFLKDIPALGQLFRRTLIDKQDEELIFFITPHIVEGSFDPSLM